MPTLQKQCLPNFARNSPDREFHKFCPHMLESMNISCSNPSRIRPKTSKASWQKPGFVSKRRWSVPTACRDDLGPGWRPGGWRGVSDATGGGDFAAQQTADSWPRGPWCCLFVCFSLWFSRFVASSFLSLFLHIRTCVYIIIIYNYIYIYHVFKMYCMYLKCIFFDNIIL